MAQQQQQPQQQRRRRRRQEQKQQKHQQEPVAYGPDPVSGDRVLVLKREWLDMILIGDKSLEIRGAQLRQGDCWLGCRGVVYGKACIGPALRIWTKQEWAALRPEHRVSSPDLPYKRTWGLPLQDVSRLRCQAPYQRRHGAIGIAKFRPICTPLA